MEKKVSVTYVGAIPIVCGWEAGRKLKTGDTIMVDPKRAEELLSRPGGAWARTAAKKTESDTK